MLKIKDLKAGIEETQILKGINLEVKAGEVHAIMGPNGSGKSTLSSVIAGKEEYEVESGEIIFNGEDLLELAPEGRAHKGVFMSFQYPVEIPGISVSNFIDPTAAPDVAPPSSNINSPAPVPSSNSIANSHCLFPPF